MAFHAALPPMFLILPHSHVYAPPMPSLLMSTETVLVAFTPISGVKLGKCVLLALQEQSTTLL